MAQTVTLSGSTTAAGAAATTPTIVLNPVSKSTTITLNTVFASTTAGTIRVEYSLDDPTIPGGPATTWALLSSAAAITSSLSDGLSWTVLSPIGQVRLNSTGGSTAGVSVYTLKALQSVTA